MIVIVAESDRKTVEHLTTYDVDLAKDKMVKLFDYLETLVSNEERETATITVEITW